MKITLKKIAKKYFPDIIKKRLKYYRRLNELKKAYKYDLKRFLRHSNSVDNDTSIKLIGLIIRQYHVIEKGLTMPQTRLGFGELVLLDLIDNCILFISKYGRNDQQLQHAAQVVLEYEHYHKQHSFKLSIEIEKAVLNLKSYISVDYPSAQTITTRDAYFSNLESSFPFFSNSRSSLRNFSNEVIPIDKIFNSLKIASNAPSACNRQAWRTYVYTNQETIGEILKIQGGNRGFGHLTNKLIIVCSNVSLFSKALERNQAFIDGGIYAMNLLYALHYNKIGACILNCSVSPEKDAQLRKLIKIPESEVFIAMIACGIPPNEFKVAVSKRYDLDTTNKVIN